MMRINIRERLFFIIPVFFILITGASVFAEQPVQVAVIPFAINAEKDFAFLKDGIVDMLTSRLSWEGRVVVVSRQEADNALKIVKNDLNANKADEIGVKLDADYVLFGSLTVTGDSISIDAEMVNVSGDRSPLSFYVRNIKMGEVIPKIDALAMDINEKAFGRASASDKTPAQQQPVQSGDIHANPEKLIKDALKTEPATVKEPL